MASDVLPRTIIGAAAAAAITASNRNTRGVRAITTIQWYLRADEALVTRLCADMERDVPPANVRAAVAQFYFDGTVTECFLRYLWTLRVRPQDVWLYIVRQRITADTVVGCTSNLRRALGRHGAVVGDDAAAARPLVLMRRSAGAPIDVRELRNTIAASRCDDVRVLTAIELAAQNSLPCYYSECLLDPQHPAYSPTTAMALALRVPSTDDPTRQVMPAPRWLEAELHNAQFKAALLRGMSDAPAGASCDAHCEAMDIARRGAADTLAAAGASGAQCA